jgi:hypothetical protein
MIGTGYFLGGITVAGVIGFGAGYLTARKRLELKYQKISDDEIAEMKVFFRNKQAAAEARVKAPIAEVVEYLGYEKAENQPTPSDAETASVQASIADAKEDSARDSNVFDTRVDHEWDYAKETKLRAANPGRPYVIHLDEYGEGGNSTVLYTYYVDDEILSDERDEAVDNVDELVGLENLQRFGHGSDNANILLVRNEALEVDIEITKSNGSYAADVHGFLQHDYAVEKMPRRHPPFDDG